MIRQLHPKVPLEDRDPLFPKVKECLKAATRREWKAHHVPKKAERSGNVSKVNGVTETRCWSRIGKERLGDRTGDPAAETREDRP
jgi:hypothetical protein